MKSIPLTQGQFALVDDDDYPRLCKYKWYAHRDGKTGKFYARRVEARKTILMHREVLKLLPGDKHKTDHIDPNQTLDNRKQNLRTCTQQQNRCNIRMTKRNRTGFKGVSPNGSGWRAAITFNCTTLYLGTFRSREEAHAAYWKKAQELQGEFARKE